MFERTAGASHSNIVTTDTSDMFNDMISIM